MTCGIYMIQNLVNGKIYIGQAVDIEKRWQRHKGDLRGNNHYNEHLQRAWNKYGEDNFDFKVLCKCDENQLNTMEEYYIFELMSYDARVGYNKNYGGGSGRPTEEAKRKLSESRKGKTASEETKRKLSEAQKRRFMSEEARNNLSELFMGEKNPFYGKHHSEETKAKLSEYHKGKPLSDEHRKRISEGQTGEKNHFYGKHHSEETRRKIIESNKGKHVGEKNPMYGRTGENSPCYGRTGKYHPMYGKHHSEESKKKISESLKGENHPMYGKHPSEETRKKMSENNHLKGKFGVKNPSSIPVVQLTLDGELVNVYGSAQEAEREGFGHQAVGKCCKGKYKTAGGYKWCYLHEYISDIHPNIKQINLFNKTYEVNQRVSI